MASPVEAILILCDAAVSEPAGKVHMLGAGWSQTGTPTAPQAVVAMLKVPWDRANQRIPISLFLRDSDGRQVTLPSPSGERVPVGQEGEIEVGRPAGVLHGSPLDASFVMVLPPMPLEPGRYEWRLEVAQTHVAASFQVLQPSSVPPRL